MENRTQQQVTALILEHTGMSETELFDMRVDNANIYLKDVMQVQDYGIEILMQSALFWDWWLAMWHKKDAEFISKCEFNNNRIRYSRTLDIPMFGPMVAVSQISFLTPSTFISTYACIHNPHHINVYPHNKIVEESFMKMTHKLVKEATTPLYKSV